MPMEPGMLGIQCGDCGAHFQTSMSGDISGAACSECGGSRFFRDQPSPTQSDGTLRDMVDSDSQHDMGGNPLGEGTIVGDDGERPMGKRDNYMHSKVLSPVTKRIEPMRTLNMEPYEPLWHESYVQASKEAGFLAPMAEAAAPMIGRMLPFALPSIMKSVMGQGGGTGQQAGGMAPQQPTPAPSMEMVGHTTASIPFLLVADMDTPQSVKSVDEQHDDPEDQDQKEFNDGDKSPSNMKNPNNEDSGMSGEDGVRDGTDGYGFGPNSSGVERAGMILPLLMHFFTSDESGQSDPLIRGLHELLEAENPGYLNKEHPEGAQYAQMILEHHKSPHTSGVNAFPSGLPAMPGTGYDGNAMGGAQGACPTCGAPLAADGSCPQCGAKSHPQGSAGVGTGTNMGTTPSYPPNLTAKVGTNGAGPQTEEQKDAVRHLLETQGRMAEVPMVDTEPWRFHQELNEIQNNPNVAPLVDPSQAQPAPMGGQMGGGMMNPPGAMPVTDPSQPGGGGGQPMMPMSHIAGPNANPYPTDTQGWHNFHPDDAAGDPGWYYPNQGEKPPARQACPRCGQPAMSRLLGNCQNCGYQMPQDSSDVGMYDQFDPNGAGTLDGANIDGLNSLKPHWGKQAADSAAPRCPKCHSGTTGLRPSPDPGGLTAECHACGNIWNVADMMDINKYKGASLNVVLADVPNPGLLDASEMHQQRPDEGQDPSMIWQDSQGRPIVPGQSYELHTAGIDIPDEVEVLAKKPDALELKLVGNIQSVYNEASAPTFHVTAQQMSQGKYSFKPTATPVQDNPDQPLGGMPGMEQIPQSGPTTDQQSSSYPNDGTLSHVSSEDVDDITDSLCHKCGGNWIDHIASSPETTMHECARCGTVWETRDHNEGRQASVDLHWLDEGPGGNDAFFADVERARHMSGTSGSSRSLTAALAKDDRYQKVHDILSQNSQARSEMKRTAGRHFTPSEQHELIRERGTARNSDLLDLEGTHYVTRYDASGKANGDNAPDEHLLLGF